MNKRPGALQFRITLQDVKPAVWRRIQTPAGYSFWDLHVAVQDAMGWSDLHLHEFRVKDAKTGLPMTLGIPDDGTFGEDREVSPVWEHCIADFFSSSAPAAHYVYDFGDDWIHEILLEESLPEANLAQCPVCIDGKGACPPEDCGGSFGYAEFLRAIKKPGSPRGSELLEWVGGTFDPKHFRPSDVVFDDPRERWAWSFDESIALDNHCAEVQRTPRRPDKHGRIACPLPLKQHALILEHCAVVDPVVQDRFQEAVTKDKRATVKLDAAEVSALLRALETSTRKLGKAQRLDRHMFDALIQYFRVMHELLREN